jgi:ADP-ribose pyrophosphatase YjhB (NUDIX family)
MPTLGVNVAIIQNREILLTKRSDFPVWCLPGGSVDNGESLAEAAIREAYEETGLDVALTRLVGLYSRPHWENGGAHEVLFAARPVGGALEPVTGETVDAGYFGPDKLPDTLLRWHYRRILDALDGMTAVARRQDVGWPTSVGAKTRQELYALRERGEMPMETFLGQVCGQPEPGDDGLDVGNAQAPER